MLAVSRSAQEPKPLTRESSLPSSSTTPPRTPVRADPATEPATEPGGEYLRDLVPATHRSQWPICVPPQPNEQPRSWLVRASHRYGLTPRQFLTAMHIPGNPPGSDLERVLLDKRSGFYAVLGTEPPEPVKIPLIDDGRLSESVPKNTSSRYCPECLASGFGWSTLWQQPWTFACPHHHIALIATCPSCGQRPWSSSSWGGRLAGQACCTEREPRPKGGTSQRSIRPWLQRQPRRRSPDPGSRCGPARPATTPRSRGRGAPGPERPKEPWAVVSHRQSAPTHVLRTPATVRRSGPLSLLLGRPPRPSQRGI
ncbi:TniQ family protein [Dermacoccus sp. Tok2021]|uniref:TniQ family protein n=1 Tax=Dermacoccus sp. Tok2021 TaxID=2826873 RepID=UPI00351D43A5|nr:TniQ family protein [Dermacoccus sp. Tok2021]